MGDQAPAPKKELWFCVAMTAVALAVGIVVTVFILAGPDPYMNLSRTDVEERLTISEGGSAEAPGTESVEADETPNERVEYRSPNIRMPIVRRKRRPGVPKGGWEKRY